MTRSLRRCRRCRYYGPITGTVGTCDYLLETGRARSLICPPGDRCTVFERRPLRARPRRPLQIIPERDPEPSFLSPEALDVRL